MKAVITAPSATGDRTRHSPLIALDWIRFLAALLVILCHARPGHWVAWNELDAGSQSVAAKLFFLAIRPGPEAVVVFFVLSGYLVGGKIIERCAAGTFSPADYFRDRVSRIFTPLVPAILLTVGCVWFLHDGFPAGFGTEVVGNVVQMQGILCERLEGNAPLWSLSYEVWFYALAGALAVVCRHPLAGSSNGRLIMAASLALFSSWCLVVLETTYLFCWVFGAFIYAFPPKRVGRWRVAGAVLAALAGVIVCQATGSYQGGLVRDSELLHKLGTLLLGASTAFLLPVLGEAGRRFESSRLARLGSQLAAFSYTLYLTHYPLQLVMRTWHTPYETLSAESLVFFLGKIVFCLVAAWALYLPFERKTPQVRRFLQTLLRPSPPASAAVLPCAKS